MTLLINDDVGFQNFASTHEYSEGGAAVTSTWITRVSAGWVPHYRGPPHEPVVIFRRKLVMPVAKCHRGLLDCGTTPPSGNSFSCSGIHGQVLGSLLRGTASDMASRLTNQISPVSSWAIATTFTLMDGPSVGTAGITYTVRDQERLQPLPRLLQIVSGRHPHTG